MNKTRIFGKFFSEGLRYLVSIPSVINLLWTFIKLKNHIGLAVGQILPYTQTGRHPVTFI